VTTSNRFKDCSICRLPFHSQDLYFLIIHSSITLTKRTFHYNVDSITNWFYLSHKFKMALTFFRNLYPGKFRNNFFVNWNFPKQNSGTHSFTVIPKQWSRNFRSPGKNRSSFWNSGFPEPFPCNENRKHFRIISVRDP